MSETGTTEDDSAALIDTWTSYLSWFPKTKMELMLRSWRRDGRAIALGAALGVLVLVLVAAAAALLGAGPGPRPPRDPFASMRDILTAKFHPTRFNATWLPDHKLLFQDKITREPLLLDVSDGVALSLLPDPSLIKHLDVFKFQISPDAKFFLIMHNFSFSDTNNIEAKYEIMDRAKLTLQPVIGPNGARYIQKVVWATGGAFAFVQDNDLFYVPNAATLPIQTVRITHTGVIGRVYNGVPCWSYDKAVFMSRPTLWFSPDARYLAYASFDDTHVGVVSLPVYFPHNRAYADNVTIRYPMPGTALPEASLWLVDVKEAARLGIARPLRLEVPQQLRSGVALLGGAQWSSPRELTAVWTNRLQDHLKLAVYDASEATHAAMQPRTEDDGPAELSLKELVYSLESREGGAADLRIQPFFSADGRSAVLPEPLLGAAWGGALGGGGGDLSRREATVVDTEAEDQLRPGTNAAGSGGGGVNIGPPLLLVRRKSKVGFLRTVLSKGAISARRVVAWDEEAHRVYFLGSGRGEPGQQFLWSVPDALAGAPHEPRCESCVLRMPHTPAGGCKHANVYFAVDRPPRFFALSCNGPGVPESAIFALDSFAHAKESSEVAAPLKKSVGGASVRGPVMAWESQDALRARVAATVLPWETRAEVPLRHGRRARVRLWLPPNYDVAKAKYPLLLDMNEELDNGPRASERFNVDWRAHLAANRSVVYAVVAAGMGPPHKGVGQDDVDDQLQAIRELVERFNYIDAARIGVWGSSRGGYLAAMTMARDTSKLVRCAIAVSPVVDWRHYNALYTERYLHLPTADDNINGYQRADLSSHAEGFRDKRLLLVHGTLDTAVHVRHSLGLALALQIHDIPFDFQLYTDEEHGLWGFRNHFYRKMEHFLEECFPLD